MSNGLRESGRLPNQPSPPPSKARLQLEMASECNRDASPRNGPAPPIYQVLANLFLVFGELPARVSVLEQTRLEKVITLARLEFQTGSSWVTGIRKCLLLK